MAPKDREERRRMRQRGAGTQQLQNVNFGFKFGAPSLPAQRSSRRTPQPLPPRPSSSQTPKTIPPRPSLHRTPVEASIQKRGESPRQSRSASVPIHSSAQTGKLKSIKNPKPKSPLLFVTPTVTGKRKRGKQEAKAAQDLEQDELEQDDEHRTSAQKSGATRARSTTTPKSMTDRDDVPDELEENDENHFVSSDQKRRERLSKSLEATPATPNINEHEDPLQSHRLRQALAAIEDNTPAPLQKRSRQQGELARIGNSNRTTRSQTKQLIPNRGGARHSALLKPDPQATAQEDNESGDELSPDKSQHTPGKQRGRKSAEPVVGELETGNVAKGDGAEDFDELSPENDRIRRRNDRHQTLSGPSLRAPAPLLKPGSDGDNELHASEDEDVNYHRRRPMKVVATETLQERGELHQSATVTENAHTRRPKRPKPSTSSKPKKKRQRGGDAAIPITIYRLFHPKPRSHTDIEGGEDSAYVAAAAINSSIRLPGVNAVDVLAQITEEILSHRITEFHEQSQVAVSQTVRSELKRKRGVVQLFNASLSDRLFELTEAVDAGTALKGRLKGVLREKLRLREEFLSIRKQREDLALKMDEIRTEHRERVRSKKERDDINAAMFDIEAAVLRGKENAEKEGRENEGPKMPLEMLLENRARDVGSDGGGLLEKVKEFNGALESAAAVFESRA
ncbi:uncharacterized protein K441DRAFT_624584 [Cenococcum geophilum 1.58]|uniref:uncharacterized protein n=1 Tax=Cenococcum geophilum 1.58 TaxID=794803 RepID=UPI00358E642F|nr:hypothetical protein K441DRAFT_624584 [Cenococcum geophilum 1.58]